MRDLLHYAVDLPPRVAVVLLMVLLISSSIPLVLGWIRLLPAEREPFAPPGKTPQPQLRDRFAIFLLANVSVSFIAAIPGLLKSFPLDWLAQFIPSGWSEHLSSGVLIWFVFIPAFASAYAAVRPNPLRRHLIVGGILVLLLWLSSPWLLEPIAGVH
jgi:hypothetical protein